MDKHEQHTSRDRPPVSGVVDSLLELELSDEGRLISIPIALCLRLGTLDKAGRIGPLPNALFKEMVE